MKKIGLVIFVLHSIHTIYASQNIVIGPEKQNVMCCRRGSSVPPCGECTKKFQELSITQQIVKQEKKINREKCVP